MRYRIERINGEWTLIEIWSLQTFGGLAHEFKAGRGKSAQSLIDMLPNGAYIEVIP